MIRLAAHDAKAAIDLLQHQQPHQPMRDGELAKAQQLFGSLAHGIAMAVSATNAAGIRVKTAGFIILS